MGLTWPGISCLAIVVVLAFGMILGGWSPAFLLPLMVLLVVAGVARPGGRALVSWIPILGGFFLRAATAQTQFTRRIAAPRATANLGLPGDAARLRVVIDEGGNAFVHDPTMKQLTAILRVTHSGTVLMDTDRQVDLDRGWAAALDAVAKFDDDVCRVQVLERTLPSGAGLSEHYQTATTGGLPGDSPLRAAYAELVARQGEALRHESLVAVSLDLKAAAGRIREMGGGMTGAAGLARQVMASVTTSLQGAGLTSAGWFDEPALALLLRSVYDPQSIEELQGASIGRTVAGAGPMGVRESWTWVQTDSAVHRVFAVTQWPRSEVAPMAMWPIVLTPGIQRSISTIYKPIAVRASRRQAETAVIEANQQKSRRTKARGWTDPADQIEQDDANRRLASITRGAREYSYVGLVTVTATDHEELRRACRVMLTAAARADLDLRPLIGQQAQHLVTASLPFGRGL